MHLAGKYFLMDGHKFGCAFLAYDQDPEVHHAKALVFVGDERE
jgi:tRNA splicing endonuclease